MQHGRPLAATITLRSGTTAWFWKIAYEEEVARASPGVQLTLDVTEQLLAQPDVLRADSCATADHPMIDHLWRERLALADLMIAPSAAALGQFAHHAPARGAAPRADRRGEAPARRAVGRSTP